ncbi:MAG TPA: cyclic-di-AMP receptor [Anaerolineales bacterium]|nr:cyclic-di-AMP receptor [Anaerolineales bacterium]
MQAMLAIVQSEDAESALDRLKPMGLPSLQRVASSGGFLRQGNTALWIAVPPGRLGQVMDALKDTCQRRTTYVPAQLEVAQLASAFPVEVEVGGATVFICEVERFEEI